VLFGLPLWFLRAAAVTFGLLWGSFLNVVIYRVPLGLSVVSPGSACPGCKTPIKGYDNIPVLSFLILRGKSRCCKTPMSVRYPLVELLGGAASIIVFEWLRSTPMGQGEPGLFAAMYAAHFALVLSLVAATFIDFEHMILPDSITLGGMVLGLVTAPFRHVTSLTEAVVTALGAFGVIWFFFNVIYRLLRGRTGMGMGDAKLLALAGAWFGWKGAAFVLFAGAIQGTIGTIILRLVMGKVELPQAVKDDLAELRRLAAEGDQEAIAELEDDPAAEAGDGFMEAAIPFGPFLILALYEYLFFGPRIVTFMTRVMFPTE
jgi:leader peptidase (prepilin peptidase)/N-methyltransferase